MERLKLVEKREIESDLEIDQKGNAYQLEDLKAVIKNLTENALKVLNRIAADEMSKPDIRAELVKDYYLLHHYLDFLKRLVSSKT